MVWLGIPNQGQTEDYLPVTTCRDKKIVWWMVWFMRLFRGCLPCRCAADCSHWQQRDPRQYEPHAEAAVLWASIPCGAEPPREVSAGQPRPRRHSGMLLYCPGMYWVTRLSQPQAYEICVVWAKMKSHYVNHVTEVIPWVMWRGYECHIIRLGNFSNLK